MTSSTTGGRDTPCAVCTWKWSAYDPGVDAVSASGWLTDGCPPQDAATVSVPEDGVTVSPAGGGVSCQWTAVDCEPAGATPSSMVDGDPTVTFVDPLGCEYATAGS